MTEEVTEVVEISDEQLSNMSHADIANFGTQDDGTSADDADVTDDAENLPEDELDTDDTSEYESDGDDDNADEDEDENIDYEAEYRSLLQPFKANGKNVSVKSSAEMIRLMQQGAGSNAKNREMNQHMKIIKQLQDNDLLDVAKLNYLIDLDKKNPDAIGTLVKAAGLDPMDIDVDESSSTYKVTQYEASDATLAMDKILDEMSNTDSYHETLEIANDHWDDASRGALLEDPRLLATLNEHVGSGMYRQIQDAIEHERMLGGLTGVNDFNAYTQVGQRLGREGAFDQGTEEPTVDIAQVKAEKLKQRRQAAGQSRGGRKSNKQETDFNKIAALSDEAFMKLDFSKM